MWGQHNVHLLLSERRVARRVAGRGGVVRGKRVTFGDFSRPRSVPFRVSTRFMGSSAVSQRAALLYGHEPLATYLRAPPRDVTPAMRISDWGNQTK